MTNVSNTFSEFLNEFQHTIETTGTNLMSFTEEETQEIPDDGGWTRKEILGHLID